MPDLFKLTNKIRSLDTFQSSLIQSLVLLHFLLMLACSFALRFMLLTQIMHNYLTWLLRSPLPRAPYVILFGHKPLIEDGNLQVYMYCVRTRKRAPGAPRTHSRTLRSQNFLGACPRTPCTESILWGPTFCICPGPPQSSWRPCAQLTHGTLCLPQQQCTQV